MSRKIIIDKYQGNTHYSVHVTDSYGTEHHLGYLGKTHFLTFTEIEVLAEEIWANEVEPKKDLMANAIKECIEIDRKAGRLPSLD
tara:strand:- start:505 stop:759 length:255 start_codon:yes stop_codon:yes gene_type:complete